MSASTGNDRFNAEAAAWDSNPFVHAMSHQAFLALRKSAPGLGTSTNVLEIGCGTGLLSMEVAPVVNRLVAVDAATSMIDVLKTKLEQTNAPRNITPVAVLLEDPEDAKLPPADAAKPDGQRMKFNLIISHLVLHHIPDLRAVLQTMLGCLELGGMVALTDFEDFGPEASRFHPEHKMEGVERHGIEKSWMKQLMEEVGFVDVSVEVAWEHVKMVERFPGEFKADGKGEPMKFSYVICVGRVA